MEEKVRIDKLLIERGFFKSRERAVFAIKKGGVLVNKEVVYKPGKRVERKEVLEVMKKDIPWVSRGGIKFEKAIKWWKINPENFICIDIGASTGGFSDVLLSYGAKKIYAVDVGRNQLHEKIAKNNKVINMDCTDFRMLKEIDIAEKPDLISIDVSYISLVLILKKARDILREEGIIIALIKPQFEMGDSKELKKGIAREKSQLLALEKIKNFSRKTGLKIRGLIKSPISGKKGNQEFIIYLEK